MNIATKPDPIGAAGLRDALKRSRAQRHRLAMALHRCGRGPAQQDRRDALRIQLDRAADVLTELEVTQAAFDRMARCLAFYGRREHWLQISSDAPHDQVLIAIGGHGSPNGWVEAKAALEGIDP